MQSESLQSMQIWFEHKLPKLDHPRKKNHASILHLQFPSCLATSCFILRHILRETPVYHRVKMSRISPSSARFPFCRPPHRQEPRVRPRLKGDANSGGVPLASLVRPSDQVGKLNRGRPLTSAKKAEMRLEPAAFQSTPSSAHRGFDSKSVF